MSRPIKQQARCFHISNRRRSYSPKFPPSMRTKKSTATPASHQARGQRAPAVIIGLDCLPGIQTARILAENGVPVSGIARDPSHPFSHTNTCDAILFTKISQDELMSTLEILSSQLDQKAVLYPCTDASVLLASRNRE